MVPSFLHNLHNTVPRECLRRGSTHLLVANLPRKADFGAPSKRGNSSFASSRCGGRNPTRKKHLCAKYGLVCWTSARISARVRVSEQGQRTALRIQNIRSDVIGFWTPPLSVLYSVLILLISTEAVGRWDGQSLGDLSMPSGNIPTKATHFLFAMREELCKERGNIPQHITYDGGGDELPNGFSSASATRVPLIVYPRPSCHDNKSTRASATPFSDQHSFACTSVDTNTILP